MAPRLDLSSVLRIRNVFTSVCSFRSFGTTMSHHKVANTVKRRGRNEAYLLAQAKARRAANLSRQEILKAERAKANGNPVRGVITPFVLSFDTAKPLADVEETHEHLNHFLEKKELEEAIERSMFLSTPIPTGSAATSDPRYQRASEQKHEEGFQNAREALRRIALVENASSKDKTRINIQRCVDKFGRHNTDLHLRPKPPSTSPKPRNFAPNEKTPRAGPDTGSSEVQIAIMTAKIRALANFLDTRGLKDKHNRRNLQLMVHKRAKLLQYLRRKERGGERWQHLTESLGLTEATWKGEIAL